MTPTNLLQVLVAASKSDNGITVIQAGSERSEIPYRALLANSLTRAQRLLSLDSMNVDDVVLLYMNNHTQRINWFWAVLAAGRVPCIVPIFKKDAKECASKIKNLQGLFGSPIIITTSALRPDFTSVPNIVGNIHTVEDLDSTNEPPPDFEDAPGHQKGSHELAALMLTSGSTGTPKAVCLTHGQILSALDGKIGLLRTNMEDVFLGWTGLDHVANLIEIHLHAMILSARQVQVLEFKVVAHPEYYLKLLSDFKVSYTFAPNFVLSGMVNALKGHLAQLEGPGNEPNAESIISGAIYADFGTNRLAWPWDRSQYDFTNMRSLVSGGEAAVLATCHQLTNAMYYYGAPASFIRPAFGLTESCAGVVYNMDCPYYDRDRELEYCSVGRATGCVSIKITLDRLGSKMAEAGQIGYVNLSGAVMIRDYYNDTAKTGESFTPDGDFITGDLGYVDENGYLHLTGRVDDIININGVKHFPHHIEISINHSGISGILRASTIVFGHRRLDHSTQDLILVYAQNYDDSDTQARARTHVEISKIVTLMCGVRPYKIIPLPKKRLQKTSLGKISRKEIRNAFEEGEYAEYEQSHKRAAELSGSPAIQTPSTATEQAILDIYKDLFPDIENEIGLDTDLFAIGLSSIDLLKIQSALQSRLSVPDIPLPTLFSHQNLSGLATAVNALRNQADYNPVVVLQPYGDKTPLWLIHPGVGEILIFMNLARYFEDRPIYALRSRGFDGDPFFSSMSENINTFHTAIKAQQPTGPYAIAGYSFGSILAFEIAKIMEANNDEVKFLATLDQAPFIKERAKSYDWTSVLLHLSAFLGFIQEDEAQSMLPQARTLERNALLEDLLSGASKERIENMGGMTTDKLGNWADLALQLKKNVVTWDPEGLVSKMDVFYTEPLVGLVNANTIDEWYERYISKWLEFVREENFLSWPVPGGHRVMISPPHLAEFVKVFKYAMHNRGI